MLAGAFMMLLSSAFLMLRLGPPSGSFPRPLSPEEERKYVDLWLSGDIEARNVLIEHNLRLVAHIIKKYYTKADHRPHQRHQHLSPRKRRPPRHICLPLL